MNATGIKESSIIFSAPMVRAIFAGLKTQTRRIIKPQPENVKNGLPFGATRFLPGGIRHPLKPGYREISCRYGKAGDRLWVRETWCLPDPTDSRTICYRASDDPVTTGQTWKSPIHMPRWASRITLEILGVRAQRVQEISHEDALAEGCRGCNWVARSPYFSSPHTDDGELPDEEFARVWDDINGAGSWESNPWVWAITFKRVEGRP